MTQTGSLEWQPCRQALPHHDILMLNCKTCGDPGIFGRGGGCLEKNPGIFLGYATSIHNLKLIIK